MPILAPVAVAAGRLLGKKNVALEQTQVMTRTVEKAD